MGIRHIIIRILEQPSIFKERFHKIVPFHSKSCLVVKKLLRTNPKMIIDVGASVGDFIRACKFNFPGIFVYAFEPIKEHNAKLKELDNIEVFDVGLWDKNEKKTFYFVSENNTESSFLKPIEYSYEERTIELKRFDNLDLEIKRPCFLKIDVEGAEDRVLEGFGDFLKEIDILQIEVIYRGYYEKQAKLSKILGILEKYGFVGFKQINITYIKGVPDKSDLIFFKKFYGFKKE
ncbi:MAG: FkbM family methyltransferase [Nanoarchaeota archaeon]|nr:FkbM family methyltransferase [Nanoarchaeota archaeon]MBU1445578.1 FkbM family methyltransferase [Nanoarchaeota archaeon]MBU2420408.1 FkbM family methyltransferase [Nanoarchaeota archaeon]MBU2475801.1 FkbM family methyltransferase [Nanoarchaeota archaeon]